ncbi:MAG: hypothetical protein V8T51_01785 [Senegalimassilia faecalis]
MEENLQGMPVLCVMAQADRAEAERGAQRVSGTRRAHARGHRPVGLAFVRSAPDDLGGFMFSQLSRGAREAINLIRSFGGQPRRVRAGVRSRGGKRLDPFFFDFLEPLSIVEIDYPNARRARGHLDGDRTRASVHARRERSVLVRYSASMPRYDMYMAAREAIEEAYKEGLVPRRYVPVTRENLFDKLAAYQPLGLRGVPCRGRGRGRRTSAGTWNTSTTC